MKIRCRECDICGKRMDFHFRIRKPKVLFGYTELGMSNYDVCGDCFVELEVLIKEKKKQREASEDNHA